ncbi:ComEA family DNA-binding protein [Ottowia testudinis]|uniref:Helix-hairpin-helix domain-containing protein n=1 Tax=Ottowia testudinis TaxID=2816950 RepID=A0A975CHR2_9BURK|nr:helix-hairpin-helix domain-containing protein [Ottowia testudinis]QTD44414.1 helix-hairpin-helix domain-containing protein [Ottowia testudinis]
MFKKLLVLLSLFYAALSFAAVDVNTGSAADLDSVKGVGPGISKRIIDERAKGQFKDWNDFITRVKGVGDKNAAKFSASGMTVNGAAYSGAPAKPAKETKAKKDKAAATPAAPATGAAPAAAGTTTTIPPIATKPAAPAVPATPAAPAKPTAPAVKQ